MKGKDIVRYSRNTLPKGKTQWEKISRIPEKDIDRAAKADLENPHWTKDMLNSATLQMPQKKVSVHMYLDQDIVDWFKSKGKGYQPRINSVLKSYVHQHLHKG